MEQTLPTAANLDSGLRRNDGINGSQMMNLITPNIAHGEPVEPGVRQQSSQTEACPSIGSEWAVEV